MKFGALKDFQFWVNKIAEELGRHNAKQKEKQIVRIYEELKQSISALRDVQAGEDVTELAGVPVPPLPPPPPTARASAAPCFSPLLPAVAAAAAAAVATASALSAVVPTTKPWREYLRSTRQ